MSDSRIILSENRWDEEKAFEVLMTKETLAKNCPNCNELVNILKDSKNKSFVCHGCGSSFWFCVECLNPWHELITCEMNEKFNIIRKQLMDVQGEVFCSRNDVSVTGDG